MKAYVPYVSDDVHGTINFEGSRRQALGFCLLETDLYQFKLVRTPRWESPKMKLLLLGATGLVGSRTLKLALSKPVFSEVIAPTRKPLEPSGRLVNPVGPSLEELIPNLMSYQPDAVICALGTTQAKAGSKEAFRRVDYELPIAVGKAAHAAGVETYAIAPAATSNSSTRGQVKLPHLTAAG